MDIESYSGHQSLHIKIFTFRKIPMTHKQVSNVKARKVVHTFKRVHVASRIRWTQLKMNEEK